MVGYAGEVSFIGQMYWSQPGDRLILGWVTVMAVTYWLAFWIERWFHVRHRLRVRARSWRAGDGNVGLSARR